MPRRTPRASTSALSPAAAAVAVVNGWGSASAAASRSSTGRLSAGQPGGASRPPPPVYDELHRAPLCTTSPALATVCRLLGETGGRPPSDACSRAHSGERAEV